MEEYRHPRNVVTLTGLFCCVCLVGLIGCASLARPIPEPKPTQVYASFSKTWVAAVDYLARSGVSLDTAERSSGVIKPDLTATTLDKSHFGSCEGSVIEFQGSEYAWNEHGGWYWYTPQFHGPPIGRPFIATVQGDSAHAKLSVRSEWGRCRWERSQMRRDIALAGSANGSSDQDRSRIALSPPLSIR